MCVLKNLLGDNSDIGNLYCFYRNLSLIPTIQCTDNILKKISFYLNIVCKEMFRVRGTLRRQRRTKKLNLSRKKSMGSEDNFDLTSKNCVKHLYLMCREMLEMS
jgi:hypothetical protein